MKNSTVIKVIDYKQQFGRTVILKNINLDINKGEILGVLGPSGAGKTTFIKALVGMNIPTKGFIFVLGQKMPSLKVINNIGYMAQSDALYEDLNAYENLMFFAELYGIDRNKAKKRVVEVLTITDLMNDVKKPIRDFSGGMRRRLSLSIALIHKPDILILDEPTVGVDPALRRQFWNEFYKMRTDGTTIIITTHVMDEASYCDRLALISKGEVIAIDTPSNLKKISKDGTIEGIFINSKK